MTFAIASYITKQLFLCVCTQYRFSIILHFLRTAFFLDKGHLSSCNILLFFFKLRLVITDDNGKHGSVRITILTLLVPSRVPYGIWRFQGNAIWRCFFHVIISFLSKPIRTRTYVFTIGTFLKTSRYSHFRSRRFENELSLSWSCNLIKCVGRSYADRSTWAVF